MSLLFFALLLLIDSTLSSTLSFTLLFLFALVFFLSIVCFGLCFVVPDQLGEQDNRVETMPSKMIKPIQTLNLVFSKVIYDKLEVLAHRKRRMQYIGFEVIDVASLRTHHHIPVDSQSEKKQE